MSDVNTPNIAVVSNGADLSSVEKTLADSGVVVSTHASVADAVTLLPYGETLAVFPDPQSAPIAWLSYPLDATWLLAAIGAADELIRSRRAVAEAQSLLSICRAMGAERDVGALHRFILRKARELTNADAGSLYLLEERQGVRGLRFVVAQTGPHDQEHYAGGFVALSDRSIAGSAAMHGRAIRIADAYADVPEGVHFDASFDQANAYRTKSVLCVPIRDFHDDIVGAIQLVNRKPTFELVLASPLLTEQLVVPFDAHDEEILTALAAQAGVRLRTDASTTRLTANLHRRSGPARPFVGY